MYKLIVLAPSAGGKSTLMRHLRAHTKLNVLEMDEEILKLNNNKWPTNDNYRNTSLVPQISQMIIHMDDLVYLASYMPLNQVRDAKRNGFRVIFLEIGLKELHRRNRERMAVEQYEDVSIYFKVQLDGFKELKAKKLIDDVLDGQKPPQEIAKEIISLASGKLNPQK